MVEFRKGSVLEFEDTDNIEFGNTNYPPDSPDTGLPFNLPLDTDFPDSLNMTMQNSIATQITLPRRLNLQSMNIGVAIWLTGMMGVLLGGVHLFKNYAAGIAWGIALVLLILSGLLDVGLELFWLSIVLTIVLLIAGLVVRWSR